MRKRDAKRNEEKVLRKPILTMEYKVLENPNTSFMTVDMVTDLSALRIDTTGVDITALYPA